MTEVFAPGLLTDRVAVVTGASRGIGAEIARRLAAAGATVIGTATTTGGAKSISAALESSGGRGEVLDVADAASIDSFVKGVGDTAPHILVNNAGITRDNLLLRMKDDEWEQVVATNLGGVFRMTRSLLRGMMRHRFGRIVSIGSVVGTLGNPGQANYAATKAGLIGFTKSVAREVASRGITANVVAPGFIETDMTAALTDAQRDAMFAQVPAGVLGQPADIANAVAFLASDAAGYITGETLHVNGGMLMD